VAINSGTSISKERNCSCIDAIRKIKDMKSILSPMGTQIETNNFANILNGIEAAHQAVESIDAKRIISTIRID
jgi:uncharacterized protein YqgV (UPF0045/DUF77 family)